MPVIKADAYGTHDKMMAKFLESLGIDRPFNQAFGTSESIKIWGGQASWTRILSDAEKRLDALIDRRNMIVHAAQPTAIVEQHIIEACDFFEAMASALIKEMPDRL